MPEASGSPSGLYKTDRRRRGWLGRFWGGRRRDGSRCPRGAGTVGIFHETEGVDGRGNESVEVRIGLKKAESQGWEG